MRSMTHAQTVARARLRLSQKIARIHRLLGELLQVVMAEFSFRPCIKAVTVSVLIPQLRIIGGIRGRLSSSVDGLNSTHLVSSAVLPFNR